MTTNPLSPNPPRANASRPGQADLHHMAQRLVRARQETGLTQAAFSARLGFSKRTYLSWERAEAPPPAVLLLALRREFGVDPAWILEGDVTGPPRGPEQIAEEAWRAAMAVEEACRRSRVVIPSDKLLAVVRAVYHGSQGRETVDARLVDDLLSLAGAANPARED